MDSFDPCLALGTSARVDSFTQTQPLLLIDTDLDVHPFRAQHTSIISGSDSHHNMSFNEEANNQEVHTDIDDVCMEDLMN